MILTISLGQMDVKLGNPAANWDAVQVMTAEAKRRGSDLVVFPELWSTGYDLENAAQYATPTNAGIFAQVAALAQTHQGINMFLGHGVSHCNGSSMVMPLQND